ncbi:MAG: hypothetical protein CMP10_20145 [Zetaproteobacteria bacterium]|nr:hypothetical protein [Pseudobdellovibrionaceae bacterium]
MIYHRFKDHRTEIFTDLSVIFLLTMRQVHSQCILALPYIALMGLASGFVFFNTSDSQIGMIGGSGLTRDSYILSAVFARKVAPIVAAFSYTFFSLGGFAAKIANMKCQRQIESLEIMGLSQRKYLLNPYIYCSAISLVAFHITFTINVIIGYWIGMNLFHNLSLNAILARCAEHVMISDLPLTAFSTLVLGYLLGQIACFDGMRADQYLFPIERIVRLTTLKCLVVAVVVNILVITILATGNLWLL